MQIRTRTGSLVLLMIGLLPGWAVIVLFNYFAHSGNYLLDAHAIFALWAWTMLWISITALSSSKPLIPVFKSTFLIAASANLIVLFMLSALGLVLSETVTIIGQGISATAVFVAFLVTLRSGIRQSRKALGQSRLFLRALAAKLGVFSMRIVPQEGLSLHKLASIRELLKSTKPDARSTATEIEASMGIEVSKIEQVIHVPAPYEPNLIAEIENTLDRLAKNAIERKALQNHIEGHKSNNAHAQPVRSL